MADGGGSLYFPHQTPAEFFRGPEDWNSLYHSQTEGAAGLGVLTMKVVSPMPVNLPDSAGKLPRALS